MAKRKAPPLPALEFLITQADMEWGERRGAHLCVVAAHALARTIAEKGLGPAEIAITERVDHISLRIDGKRIL